MFTKFLCWAHVRGHVLWTWVSILENLLLLFLYLLCICIWVLQINIFQFFKAANAANKSLGNLKRIFSFIIIISAYSLQKPSDVCLLPR